MNFTKESLTNYAIENSTQFLIVIHKKVYNIADFIGQVIEFSF
jgi:hypothetical protein